MAKMLFSYNHAKSGAAWSHEEFHKFLSEAVRDFPGTSKPLNHAHWLLELQADSFAFTHIGQAITDYLAAKREDYVPTVEVLALGGKKLLPSAFSSLEVGDWGVDVVETHDAQAFLSAINWQAIVLSKDSESVFEARSSSI